MGDVAYGKFASFGETAQSDDLFFATVRPQNRIRKPIAIAVRESSVVGETVCATYETDRVKFGFSAEGARLGSGMRSIANSGNIAKPRPWKGNQTIMVAAVPA